MENEILNNTVIKVKLLSQILDAADLGTEMRVIFNKELQYIAANKATCRHLGIPADELFGKSILDLYPEITASPYHRNLLKAFYGETIERDRTQSSSGDYFSATYKPIWDADEIVAVLVSASKIIAHAENPSLNSQQIKQLQDRADILEDFIENAALPLHCVNGSGVIIWANQFELDMLGYEKEEYIGRHISNFHADKDVIEDILVKLINKETLINYPARLKARNGDIKKVLINSNVYWKEDEFVHTRCFTREFTDMAEAIFKE